jgi:hypothetical protein
MAYADIAREINGMVMPMKTDGPSARPARLLRAHRRRMSGSRR